ncbi:MAG: branched-chain amino acid ABC transporter permease [Bacillota bacterium]
MKAIARLIIYSSVGLLAAVLPLFLDIPKPTMTLLNTAVIYSIIAVGYNILLGYGGQISLGHAVFMGLGAYMSAYMTAQMKLPFVLSLVISGLVPMLIGALLGLAALRLEGHYLAIATLGFGVAVQQVFKEWVPFTNGYSGVKAPYPQILFFEIKSREHFFIMSAAILILLCIFAFNMINSKTGRALIAMRDSEHAAQAMGISLFKYKLIAFAVSAFYAGVAGSLYAHLIRFIEPSMWSIELSLNLLAMVVIGGLASIGGAIVGAFFLTLVPEIIKSIPFLEHLRNFTYIFTGACLIIAIIFMPYGLSRLGSQLRHKYGSILTGLLASKGKGRDA